MSLQLCALTNPREQRLRILYVGSLLVLLGYSDHMLNGTYIEIPARRAW